MKRLVLFRAIVGTASLWSLGLLGCSSDEGKPSSLIEQPVGTDAGDAGGSAPLADAGGADANVPAKKGLAADCVNDSDCESNVCFKSDRGDNWCSVACTTATAAQVCVPPLDGACNRQGFCRRTL